MIDLTLQWNPANNYWITQTPQPKIIDAGAAWAIGKQTFCKKPREYFLEDSLRAPGEHSRVQTLSIHGRSCYLGSEQNKYHYFAKGIGWIQADGWEENIGNLGVLPLWAGLRERDLANALSELGISTVKPIAIKLHELVPRKSMSGITSILAEEIKDLDGTNAIPCMYIYASKSRWRLADLPYLSKTHLLDIFSKSGGIENWLQELFKTLAKSSAVIHQHNGHDFSLSAHNVFTSGERLDFEYVALDGYPHRDNALNSAPSVWQKKEIYGLLSLCWEVCDLLGVTWSAHRLQRLLKEQYEETSQRAFPF